MRSEVPSLYLILTKLGDIIDMLTRNLSEKCYRFTTYQDARRVRLVDGLETNILRVSPVKKNVKLIQLSDIMLQLKATYFALFSERAKSLYSGPSRFF